MKQTIAASKQSGNLISELGKTTDLENDAKVHHVRPIPCE